MQGGLLIWQRPILPLPMGEVARRSRDGEMVADRTVPLPLPMGEVARHSRDGEGETPAPSSPATSRYFRTHSGEWRKCAILRSQ